MNLYSCSCCQHLMESSENRANFFNKYFIPSKWKLQYYSGLSENVNLILTGYCQTCHGDLEESVPLPEALSGDDLLKGIYDTMQSAHPYTKFCETSGYYGDCEERIAFYCRRDKKPQFERSKEFLDLFHDYDRAQVRHWLEQKFPPQSHTEVFRDTAGDLFSTVVRMARQAGDLEQADKILDYILPRKDEADTVEGIKLTAYEFDFVPIINFGGSEGIYVDCYLKGKFDESGRYSLHIGTLKTLETSLSACKIMGELCGTLMYYERRYVNQHLHRYTPDAMLRAEAKRLDEMAAGSGEGNGQ